MKLPVWTKPAVYGAVAGAIVLAVVGFTWGGWTTSGAATDLASKEASAAVVSALVPYCVQNAAAGDVTLVAELEAASTFGRRAVVEKAGWATPLGTESPNRELAQACQLALAAAKAS